MLTSSKNTSLNKYFDTIFVLPTKPIKKYTGSLEFLPINEKIVRFQVPINMRESKVIKNRIMSCNKENIFTERPLYICESRYKYHKIY